jgi:pimeloyl-ACP methyl ester carboxylesterase
MSENELPALGICFEEYAYPHPVRFVPVQNDLQTLAMAYMDVPPDSEPNGKTVVLMHGKAFGGYYFEHVIEALTTAGYRVVVPDQIGWGKSPKPDIHYSFHLFAANTADLLDHLGIGKVAVLGHSTGGMTATRFTLMNPDRVTHLVLEDSLGLADYRIGIPPQSEETLYEHEVHWTDPAVIRGYVAGYFVHPDPAVYEPLADVLVRVTLSPDYPSWARAAGGGCPAGRLRRALSRGSSRHTAGHTGSGARLRAHSAHRASGSVSRRVPPLPGELTKGRRSMSTHPEAPASSEGSVEIGPRPTSRSALLGAAAPSYGLARRGRSDLAEDPS